MQIRWVLKWLSLAFSPLLALGIITAPAPSKLVVLQHGLYGSATNLRVLEDALQALAPTDVLVYAARASEGTLTRDGISRGGVRLAHEIEALAQCHASLCSLCIVGNSLGGLYARYAAATLFDEEAGTMAGLIPDAFITIGCPHLGVRRFTFAPLPALLHRLGGLVAGRTANELLLRDGRDRQQPLLLQMSGGRFARALSAFRRRRLYANLVGDFMVPFGTAAIEADAWGAGIGDERAAKQFIHRPCSVTVDTGILGGRGSGVGMLLDVAPSSSIATPQNGDLEGVMAVQLNSCGWTKVVCRFQGASTWMPMAHNKLAALRREGWRRVFEWIEQAHEGAPVMQHLANFIIGVELDGVHGRDSQVHVTEPNQACP
mmetsp:Transcript_56761/g.130342  ORF Transcript_56761/g.130342 Transcript_56761/m.130342 type:complete len:374 (-) Transcript_56761:188-1309(-)